MAKVSTGQDRKRGKGRPEEPLRRVGMRNPNALAEAYLRRPIDWRRMNHRRTRGIFEFAFDMDFGELFDPASGSPLYKKSLSSKTRGGGR